MGISLCVALVFGSSEEHTNPLERDAIAFMSSDNQRRRLAADVVNYTIIGSCNNTYPIGCNIVDETTGNCQFQDSFGTSCFSSYMTWGFGLIVFVMLPFLCLGCCVMADVSTPLRVPTRLLPVRKEY